MKKIKKTLMVTGVILGMSLLCSCGSEADSGIDSTEELTTEITTTEATTTEATTTEATTTEATTTEATTTEATTTEESTTRAVTIRYNNDNPLTYDQAVDVFKSRTGDDPLYLKSYWVVHDDKYYSIDPCSVNSDISNKSIKFARPGFSYVLVHPGDKLVKFGDGIDFKISFVESEGYTIPQQFRVDADNGSIKFYKTNLTTYMDNGIMPLSNIYEINGDTASNIQDYVEVNGDYYLSYSNPTDLSYKYYYDYESIENTASASTKYWTIGETYGTNTETAPEGYMYYTMPENLSDGLYCIYGAGDYFILKVGE